MCSFKKSQFFSEFQCFLHANCELVFIVSKSNHCVKITIYSLKTELVYFGRQRTTSFTENDSRINRSCNYNPFNNTKMSNIKQALFSDLTCKRALSADC